MWYDPDGSLSNLLAVIAQNYDEDFRAYWGLDAREPPDDLDEEYWRILRILDQLATKFFHAAKSLRPQEGENLRALIANLREQGVDLTQDKFVRDKVELEIARELEDELEAVANRALRLLDFLVSTPFERARRYLERVADCYIRGLATETVVMCGAVLDAALQETVDDSNVKETIGSRGKTVSVGERLTYLTAEGAISRDVADQAFKLLNDRNDAVHFTPGLVVDVDAAIQRLAEVLQALENWSNAAPGTH